MSVEKRHCLAHRSLRRHGCGASTQGRQRAARLAGALLIGLAVAGCANQATSGSATAGSGSAHAITIEADPGGALRYVQSRARAAAGAVTITFRNRSGVPHDLHIVGRGVDERTATITDGSSTIEVTLGPGSYAYYCDVPGHRAAGMEGTLSVR